MLMSRDPADWLNYMNDRERKELALSEKVRDAATDQHRLLRRRIKDRCIKRMRRSKDG
jgi:hypothetical protein